MLKASTLKSQLNIKFWKSKLKHKKQVPNKTQVTIKKFLKYCIIGPNSQSSWLKIPQPKYNRYMESKPIIVYKTKTKIVDTKQECK